MHPMRITSRRTAANRTCKTGFPVWTRKPDFSFRQRFKSSKGFIFLPRPFGDDLRLRIYLVMVSETFWYCCALVLAPVPVTWMT